MRSSSPARYAARSRRHYRAESNPRRRSKTSPTSRRSRPSPRAAAQSAPARRRTRPTTCICASCSAASRFDLRHPADAREFRAARAGRTPLLAHRARARRVDPGLRARGARPQARRHRALEPLFKEAFLAAWRGDIENDGFNRLLLCAGLSAREIVVLRAYCRYLLQTGMPFSQAYMERVLVAQAPITRAWCGCSRRSSRSQERAREAPRSASPGHPRALDKVASLDEDRILRAYLAVIRATLRTNYYQTTADGTLEELGIVQARPASNSRPAAAAAEVRDLRLQPARRRRAPAHGRRGARRHRAGPIGAKTSAPKCWAS